MAASGFCARTCGRCGSGNATVPSAPSAPVTAPGPSGSLTGNLAQYGKVRTGEIGAGPGCPTLSTAS